jgi:hypothetical protein
VEEYVNDYNILLLLLWRGNIDIQFISDINGYLDDYLTPYLTKYDIFDNNEMCQIINNSKSLHSKLKSIALLSMKKRQICIMEACHKLLGYAFYEISQNFKFLGCYLSENRKKKIKLKKDIEEIASVNPTSTDLYYQNILDTYYPNRPNEIKNMCLYDFSSIYDYKKLACDNTPLHRMCLILKNNKGYLHKRNKPYYLTTPFYTSYNEYREKYFHQLIILFKPWFNENTDLLYDKKNYEESFRYYIENGIISTENTIYCDQKNRINEAKNILNQPIKLDIEYKKKETKIIVHEKMNSRNYDYLDDLANLGKINIGNNLKNSLNDRIQTLNQEQKQLFDSITQQIYNQVKFGKQEKIRKFTTGTGGI